MRTPTRVGGHPIHPMLVVFPLGLWGFSFICDLGFVATGNPSWQTAAYFAMGGGIVGAALAAIPGFVDGLFLRKSPLFRTVLTHMAFMVLALTMFIASFLARSMEAPHGMSLAISTIGIFAMLLGGWFGGDLVYRHGMGVEPPSQHRHPILTAESRDEGGAERIRRHA